MGRTGKMFALDHSTSEGHHLPRKGLGSGLPIGACRLCKVMDWHKGAHASTFGASVALAAAVKTIELLEAGAQHARDVEPISSRPQQPKAKHDAC